jgi:hypothetical protein
MDQEQGELMHKQFIDMAAAVTAVSTFFHWMPAIGAFLSVAWFVMRFYEKFTGTTIGKKPIDK